MSDKRANLNKNIKTIYRLVSDLVYLHHPITMDIRWLFHKRLASLDGREGWAAREVWHELVSTYHYSLWQFIKSVLTHNSFSKSIIRVLSAERTSYYRNSTTSIVFVSNAPGVVPFGN